MDYYSTIRSLNPLDNKLFSGYGCNYHKDVVITSDMFNDFKLEVDEIQKEFYPNTCTAEGLLSNWEELTGSARYYINNPSYSDDQKRQIITAIFTSNGGFNRRAFEIIFEMFGFTIVYASASDNIDGSTIRIVENINPPFRADYSVSGPWNTPIRIDKIYDDDNTDKITFYTYADQNNDIMALLETIKCLDSRLEWVKL